MFDVLSSAFFGTTLALYLWEVHRRKVIRGAGLLAAAVAVLIALSICRGIIIGVVLVYLVFLIMKKGIIALPIWPLALAGIVGVNARYGLNNEAERAE